MNSMEEWKPILDYPDYEVSNLGNVRRNGKILKPAKNECGYYFVTPCKNSKSYSKKIHRLVAEAFLPNPDNKRDVDHIDRNRTNNVATNLRWATHSENCLNTKSRDKELFGIYFDKQKQKYQVKLTINQKLKHFGTYATLEEAIKVRDDVCVTLRNTNL